VNLAGAPEHAALEEQLAAELVRLRREFGDA
jgi:hypothetical protein